MVAAAWGACGAEAGMTIDAGTVAFDIDIMRGLIGLGWIAQRADGMCRIVRPWELEELRRDTQRYPSGVAADRLREVTAQIGGLRRGSPELHVAPWLAVVPDLYRAAAETACREVFARWINQKVGEREEREIVGEIRVRCLTAIESGAHLAASG